MKYYVTTATGAYIGGFSDELDPPANSTEVPSAPEHASQIWDFDEEEWLPYVPHSIEDECAIIPGAYMALRHDLSHDPNIISFYLKCIEAELGYSVNQKIIAKCGVLTGKNGEGPALAITSDSEFIYVRFSSSSPVFQAVRFDTGARQNLSNDHWVIKFNVS